MIVTNTFYIYKTDTKLNVETFHIAWRDLDERTKALFFDAQDDIELTGLDIGVFEEDEEYREGLEEFMAYMEDAEDSEQALTELGMDDMTIEFILSGETIVGYIVPDSIDPEITYVASFTPISSLKNILYGAPQKETSPLPLLRHRKS